MDQVRKFFHLDCHAVIPECGYRCPRCIEEIRSVVGGMPGVSEVSLSKRGEVSGMEVRFDQEIVDLDNLMAAFGKLPSFYQGRFVPEAHDL